MIRSEPKLSGTVRKPMALPQARDDTGFGPLFHLSLWGGAAAACLLLVAFATRTESGHARMLSAYAVLTGVSEAEKQQSAARERELDDARRMTAMIRNLTEDRDRLLARMTALERNYEDVTGSIGKLANGPKPPEAEAAAANQPAATPVASAPATTAAAAPAAAPAPAALEQPGAVSTKSEFGIDIGGAPTLAGLRSAWDRASRNHGVLLDGLRPLIAVRDGRAGQVELRLVVGPIGNAAAAARLCAALAGAGLSCQPTMFEGQRLALR
jgi:pyruvate/2-oxoglutarate dehydrogenase complex dihydrolipoamide acyltransferase (E2) component